MRSTIAVIAAESELRERLTDLLGASRLVVLDEAWDPLDVSAQPDAAVVACPASDPGPLLRHASEVLPASRLIAVLSLTTRQTVRRALRAGASALVREARIDETLVLAVQSACAGQLSIPIDLTEGLEKPVLSSREKQILGMVVMGLTNGQVARRLFLAESTVKSHMSSIFCKLGVVSRKEAVALVLDPEEGLGMGILGISEAPAHAAGGPPSIVRPAETFV